MDFFYNLFGWSTEDEETKKKKSQVLSSGSVQTHHKRPDISVRRARSTVGDSAPIDEDEILESYTNIEAPNDNDSAIGSANEDDDDDVEYKQDKQKLRRLESKEHSVGSEQYIVVDFIGNLEASSRESSTIDAPIESTLSASPQSNISAFEEIYGDASVNDTVSDSSPEDSEQDSSVSDVKVETVVPSIKIEEKQPKKQFSAGRGLKKIKKEKEAKPVEKEEKSKTEKETDSDSSSSSKRSLPYERTKDIQRSSSNRDVSRRSLRDSPRLEKTPSLNSERPTSIVMQNKLLFDQQIAEGLKKKYPSAQNLDRPRRTSNLDLSNFERPKVQYSGSFNEKRKPGGEEDVDLSGIFAASRSMFEQGGTGGKTKPRTISLPKHISQEIRRNEVNKKHTTETKPDEEDKKRADSTLSTQSNPLLSNYKENEIIPTSSKKKKFPFKKRKHDHNDSKKEKKKVDKTNSVELLGVKSNDDTFEERAIDVPVHLMHDTPKEEIDDFTEKKKKGLFSRMRKHRKSSSDSDHELKHSLEQKQHHSSVGHEEFIEESVTKESTNEEPQLQSNENDVLPVSAKDMPITGEIRINTDVDSDSRQVSTHETDTSSEISSVLENIIDRKTSVPSVNESAGKGKKKKFLLKKKKPSNVNKHSEIIKASLSKEKVIETNAPIETLLHQAKDRELLTSENLKLTALDKNNAITPHSKENTLENASPDAPNSYVISNAEDDDSVAEEQITEVIRTNKLVSDWSIDIEDMLEEEHRNDVAIGEIILEDEEVMLPDSKESENKNTQDAEELKTKITMDTKKLDQINHEIDERNEVDNNSEPSTPTINIDCSNLSVETSETATELENKTIVDDIKTESGSLPSESDSNYYTESETKEGEVKSAPQDEEGDDVLAELLEAASHRDTSHRDNIPITPGTASEADSISFDDNSECQSLNESISDEKEKKKKKRFKFPLKKSKKDKLKNSLNVSLPEGLDDTSSIKSSNKSSRKGKKDKQKNSLNVSLPEGLDDTSSIKSNDKSARKFKRPKSLEILAEAFPRKSKSSPQSRPESLSQEDIERLSAESNSPFETNEKGKKKKSGFFSKLKRKSGSESPVKASSFVTYTNPSSTTKDNIDSNDVKHIIVSSDEFSIPENNIDKNAVTNGHSELTNDAERKYSVGPDHKEFIKTDEILEVKKSDSMQF